MEIKTVFSPKIIFLVVLPMLLFLPTYSQAQQSDNYVRNKTHLVAPRNLKVDGNFRVIMDFSDEEELHYEVPQDVSKDVLVAQKGETLRIRSRKRVERLEEPLVIKVGMKQLSSIVLSGGAELNIRSRVSAKSVKICLDEKSQMRGSFHVLDGFSLNMKDDAKADLQIDGMQGLKVNLKDNAELKLDGKTSSMKLSMGQCSKFSGNGFSVDKADVRMMGNTSAILQVNRILRANIGESARLVYDGHPKTKIRTSGLADIVTRRK